MLILPVLSRAVPFVVAGAFLLGSAALRDASTANGQVQLPESPAARAWAGVGANTQAVDLDQTLFADAPWLLDLGSAAPSLVWRQWAEWLPSEDQAAGSEPQERAGLVVLAVQQERWNDAWTHFERLGANPEWAAAVMPLLVPGVPIDMLAQAAQPGFVLPADVVLRPAIPPHILGDPPKSLRTREAWVRGLRVGEAQLDVRISIEPSGIEVDVHHVAGGATSLRVILPEPEGYEVRVEYIDWMRQEEKRVPLALQVLPDEEEHNLFGRFTSQPAPMPSLPHDALPISLTRGGLWFKLAAESEHARSADALASAIGSLLHMPAGSFTTAVPPPTSFWNATIVQVPEGKTGRDKLVQIVSLTESFVIAGRLKR